MSDTKNLPARLPAPAGKPPYDKPAGGADAVVSSMRHTIGKAGLVRGTKLLLQVNQPGGFDCPGCAWPDPAQAAHLEFCENGAKAVADEGDTRRVGPEFFARHSIDALLERTDYWLNEQGRLTHPMVLREGSRHYEPIAWDEAFEIIAEELAGLDSPDEALFYTSGRTSNEAAFLYGLFVRMFGTNNMPDCSNMCHESSGVGMKETLGVAKGTVSLEDFELADAIFIFGQNPGTNHPRMLSTLQAAKRRGCTIVSVNPLREAGLVRFKHPKDVLRGATDLTDLHLPVRINGDVALIKGLMKAILEEEDRRPGEVLDHAFIAEHTSGFEAFRAALDAVDWDTIVEHSGVDREAIELAARVVIDSERLICCWAMGLTQHKNAVANIQEVVNLLLLGGHMGRPGAGACPVRGHSNVQGDRTMGIWERPDDAFLDRLAEVFGFEPPRKPGYDAVAAIHAMARGQAHVFIGLGGNFVSATPDTNYTSEALRRCRLTVQISTKLNRSHLVCGRRALILPCLGRTELDRQQSGAQRVTVENSMSVVHASQGRARPASEHLLSEPVIVARMAHATLARADRHPELQQPGGLVDWLYLVEDYDRIRDLIARTIPGFERFNERLAGEGSFVLPNGARERRFDTSTGRARFTVHAIEPHRLAPGQLLMMTIRSHDQYNTTIYGLDDRYRGIRNERRVVLVHPDDIAQLGFAPGERVDLRSHYADGVERIAHDFVLTPYEMPRRSAATYFPEANVLVPVDHKADGSHTPASKSVVITLERAAATGRGEGAETPPAT